VVKIPDGAKEHSVAARDLFHEAVRNGLIKDGWTITADPLLVEYGTLDLYIDLGAEKLVGAEKDGQRIAVEIKSFLGPSTLTEFHLALGQYLNYRLALKAQEPERALYLAVPTDIFEGFFSLPFTQAAVKEHGLRILVYDSNKEEIVRWTS
jgi:hypothetical protein